MHQPTGGDEGFNLLELMAVLTIIGIILAIAVASYTIASSRAGSIACASNRRELDKAVQVFVNEHAGPPTDLGDLSLYIKNLDQTRHCPAKPRSEFTFDGGTLSVSCPTHGR
jgi:prepilin-type N-terminal cleavage/methylation domain-containing protein